MYFCICSSITIDDLRADPSRIVECGQQCGKCIMMLKDKKGIHIDDGDCLTTISYEFLNDINLNDLKVQDMLKREIPYLENEFEEKLNWIKQNL